MRRLFAVLALTSGCDVAFNLRSVEPSVNDAATDGRPTTGCFGNFGAGNAGLYSQCIEEPARATWTPPNGELITETDTNCDVVFNQTGGPSVCVIIAQNITLGGTLAARGGRPLVLVATDTLTVLDSALISVDSRHGAARLGAGSNDGRCALPPAGAAPTTSTQGGGGGAGGSFGTVGGGGGNGLGGPVGGTPAPAVAALVTVRGGCRGGGGGIYPNASTGSGASGGAVYLIAGREIAIAGTIDASGEAGDGGSPAAIGAGTGGGGGGSGGLIGVDAPRIVLTSTARLVANGGGGGGGSDGGVNGMSGADGGEANLSGLAPFIAVGGPGGAASGDGGRGGDRDTSAMKGGAAATNVAASAGGGGGGGAGIIKFFTTTVEDQGAVITPAKS
jgi:hypothetical protein